MNLSLLKTLSEAAGVPGREDNLRAIVRRELGPLVDDVRADVMGNVLGRKARPGARRVMIAAHMDEIGFMVRHIDDKGFLRLQPLGGFDPRVLFAQRVLVHPAGLDPWPGVLAYSAKPTHLQSPEEAKESPKIENFFVDTGRSGAEVKAAVRIGDMVTLDRACAPFGSMIVGKAMDNRIGLFVMIEALRAARNVQVEVVAAATVQEEIGLRGATTATFGVEPDIGIALDTTIANDIPGLPEADAVTKLGAGVGIKIMDASLICHPLLVAHMRDLAEAKSIPFQMEILPRGGTDGGALQRSRGGIASITLSVPTRYIHTVNEMVAQSDVQAAIALLAAYLEHAHEREYVPA